MGNAGHENDLGEQQLEPQVWALAAEVKMQGPFQLWKPQCPRAKPSRVTRGLNSARRGCGKEAAGLRIALCDSKHFT